jgi:phospho-N-acetylmuramoyl-pentapeptide-transferase
MISCAYSFFYNSSLFYCGMLSLLINFIISLISGKIFLLLLQKVTQSKVREYTPITHSHKNNTPTMGGLFILTSVFLSTICTLRFTNHIIIIIYLTLISFGAIGFYDDWCKINKTRGIAARTKFILQLISAASVLSLWAYYENPSLTLALPFISPTSWPYLGYFFIPWGAFVMVGTSNAVNLTDGLDGLATQSLIPNFILLACIVSTITTLSPMTSATLVSFTMALAGSLGGFLWYNKIPARVFMGDVGSLPLGAVLALLFLMIKKEYLLPFSGIVFVLETVSVMLQVYSIKLRNTRIFRMAPFHHHLELCGWSEQKIVLFLSLCTLIGCMTSLCLSTI